MSHNHSHACGDESHGHDHDHSHGPGGHTHDDDITPAIQSSLYRHIEFDKIITFNEETPGSGKAIVKKTWEERLNDEPVLESDDDEQLLIYVPFTGDVRLHSILVRADPSPAAPRTLKLFINRDDLDFSAVADTPAIQTLELPMQPPGEEVMELPIRRALFNNIHSITIFVEDNHSDGDEDVTRLSYLGFKGDFTALRKDPVIALYEAAPNPADHKNLVPGTEYGSMGL
ncbi:galactose-binding domain-like protein [Pyronema omphalodes]|nr:galactose-binding domain-like protein [Pyronema omphalodes]